MLRDLKPDRQNGRELGNAVMHGSVDGTQWEQDMLTAEGKPVTVIYRFTAEEAERDTEQIPFDDAHVEEVREREE